MSRPLLLSLALMYAATAAGAEETRRGEQIFKTLCTKCHGTAGEGTKQHHPDPLVGDRSLAELARLIEKTMPEDDPGKCVGEDAREVAEFIYHAFYSPTARVRNQPARIELSRLTVRQYQNAVTDLIGGFRGESLWGNERGLRGIYFKSRRFRDDEIAVTRTDPVVAFDFGDAGPEADKFDVRQFSIRWEGSVLAPETGDYEFVVATEHATRLWVNNLRQSEPLIDAWVKSGNDTQYRGAIRLLGGWVYPLRLEFSKSKQGVDDSKKQKELPPPVKASVVLRWRLPHQEDVVIPEHCLSPQRSPEVFVLQSPFPPDDRSTGYERGTSISKAWDQATTDAAIEVADYVTARLDDLAGVKISAPDRAVRLREFGYRFARRAFRRPLSDEQQKQYVDHQFDHANSPEAAMNRSLLLVLKSPRFLYRELAGDKGDEPYDTAARLSFGLWDSLPDKELLRAAKAGELTTRVQVARQADRMTADLRTRTKLRAFFLNWFKVEQVPDLRKDREQYPTFDHALAADLRTSLELFIDDVVWGDRSDFRKLLLSNSLPMNERLAKFYGATLPDPRPAGSQRGDASFVNAQWEPEHRAGVLTHPYLLATFAHSTTSSPIHRGVFISRNLLGRALKPPPEAQEPLAPELHPDLTTRERIAMQTESNACMVCHATINPLGFTLEHFDAVGRFRAEEKGKPVDSTGGYQTRTGEIAQFKGVRDLARFLADSDETHAAFVEQLFHALVKQPVRAYGPDLLSELRSSFQKNDYNVRRLAAEIVAATALPRVQQTAAQEVQADGK